MSNKQEEVPRLQLDVHTFESGAKSSGRLPRFDLIPWDVFAVRLAARYELGLEKYSEDNWRNGLRDKQFVLDRLNHMLDHAHKAAEHIRRTYNMAGGPLPSLDDDLAAVMWGAIFLMAAQQMQEQPAQASTSSSYPSVLR